VGGSSSLVLRQRLSRSLGNVSFALSGLAKALFLTRDLRPRLYYFAATRLVMR